MACLRSFSRRSLYPKWFCCKTSRPVLHLHTKEDFPEPSFSGSTLLIRRFHRHVFFEARTKMSFAQPVGSGAWLCRHFSSKPEESYSKIDAFGNVVEELFAEKSVEALATNVPAIAAIENFSFPADIVQYVVNGIHELTGFNWWMSVVLTAFLVNGLMSPISMRMQRQARELLVLVRNIENVKEKKKVGNPETVAKCEKWEAELMKGFEEVGLSFMKLFLLDAFIYISFIDGINVMAKKIPDLSTSDSLYILPLMTGFTFWWSSERHISRSNLKTLPLFPIIFIALQATYEFEPAIYFYMITSRIYISTLILMVKYNKIVKLRSILGWPDVPVTTVSEQQNIMARLISLMREWIDSRKEKKNK